MDGELLKWEKICVVSGVLLLSLYYYSFLFFSIESIVGLFSNQSIIIAGDVETLYYSFLGQYKVISMVSVFMGGGLVLAAVLSYRNRINSNV